MFTLEHAEVTRAEQIIKPFLTQPGADDPDERVEPVDGAHDFGHHLDQPVPPFDVRQLVKKDDADALFTPV